MPKTKPQTKKPAEVHWTRKLSIFYHKPHMVPVITIALLILITLVGLGALRFIYRNEAPTLPNRIVIVSYDKDKQVVPSNEATVGALLNELSINLNKGDRVEPSLDTKIDQDQFRINVYRAVPIELVDGQQQTFTFSAATTPRSIAAETGETLYAEDKLTSIPTKSFIKDGALGQRIVIERATPVNMDLYGTTVVMRTHAKTVGEMLKERNIKLTKDDRLLPAPSTPITAGAQVAILRSGKQVKTIEEAIAMPVKPVYDNSLAYGTSAVRQAGSPGKKVVTYEVTLSNNKEVSRKVLQEVITTQPVTQITVVGTSLSGIKGDMAYAGISPNDYKYVDLIVGRESGWCPTKWQGEHGSCPPYHGTPSSPSVGYGLCQSTPASKMASAGSDWATNPVTQLKWCANYAKRYGGWQGAYNFWQKNHWW
jgi:uncharacterized protein YabE (DUF348 family)